MKRCKERHKDLHEQEEGTDGHGDQELRGEDGVHLLHESLANGLVREAVGHLIRRQAGLGLGEVVAHCFVEAVFKERLFEKEREMKICFAGADKLSQVGCTC